MIDQPLRPLDMATVLASVAKTHRLVIVDEGWRSGSISAEIAMREWSRRRSISSTRRSAGSAALRSDSYAAHLERAALPQKETIAAAARGLVRPSS